MHGIHLTWAIQDKKMFPYHSRQTNERIQSKVSYMQYRALQFSACEQQWHERRKLCSHCKHVSNKREDCVWGGRANKQDLSSDAAKKKLHTVIWGMSKILSTDTC